MPLRGPDLLDPAKVGHKFARLEELRAAGFDVPDLYALPATAFDLAVGEVRAQLPAPPARPGPSAVRAWSAKAVEAVRALTVPQPLAAAALAAFDAIAEPGGLVAVRACVVPAPGQPGEDDAGDPFAGMSDSFLYVPRAELLDRVVECWASAYKAEAVLYRMRRGGDPAAARVAVGVQQMVLGASSFVVFTRDPRDGADRQVVAAAYGIGEGVVQERADIDHYFADAATGQIERHVAVKRRMVGPPEPGDPPEPMLREVPSADAEQPVLDDDRLSRLLETTRRIEAHFGAPQDIEGAFAADGRLRILQSRPLVPPAPTVLWSNHNITESYPGVSGALTYSLAQEFYRAIFADLYRRLGVPDAQLRQNAHHLARMVGLRDGRVFYRLDSWYVLHGQMREFEFVRGWWEHSMGLAAVPGFDAAPGWRRRLLKIAPGLSRRAAAHFRAVRGFLAWWDELADEAADLETRDAEQLVAFYRRLWAEVAVRWGVTLTNTILNFFVADALDGLLRRWAGQRNQTLLVGLLAGGPENRTLAGLRSALALAESVGAHPVAREQVLSAGTAARDDELWREIVGGAYGPELARAAAKHLRRYGDRAAGDLKLEQLTPRQCPAMVLEMLRPLIRQGRTAEASRADERRVRTAAERELREHCPSRLKRAVILALAARMRAHVKAREDTRFSRTELFGLSRRVLLRLGALLAGAGHLDEARDVFDLTVEEVIGAFDGTVPGTDLRGLAAVRRDERELCEALPAPPSQLVSTAGRPLDPARPLTAAEPEAEADTSARIAAHDGSEGGHAVLRGLASSAGIVRACAKVVLHPGVPADTCRDTILVARETDPGWLFLMTAAKGLIVERGTLLSHTAVTGRLLGVPTVVAVPGATSRIPDGALVELDGSAGTVRILAQPSTTALSFEHVGSEQAES
jgi:rifampicin phosphotransferase